MNRTERVVVTGIGAVSPFGWGVAAFRRGLLAGKCAVEPSRDFDTRGQRTQIVGEVETAPEQIDGLATRSARLTRTDLFAVAAATEACRNASLSPSDCSPGVFFGGSTAGMVECEEYVARLLGVREGKPSLGLLTSQQLNGPGDAVARSLATSGPVESLSSACASGALAIGAALDALRTGEVEVAVAGGSDGLCLLTYSGFNALRLVAPGPCLPFRKNRRGMNLGEGSGVLVLETLAHARGRGARPIAELLGAGASCDAHHMTGPDPEGRGLVEAIRKALAMASISPADTGSICAHGTATRYNDSMELAAFSTLFGSLELPVYSVKGTTGHTLAAAGLIETLVTLHSIHEGFAPPTAGLVTPDSAAQGRVTRSAVDLDPRQPALTVSAGFGGVNAALVLK